MSANKPKIRYGLWILFLLVVLPFAFQYFATPVVAVNFSANSEEHFRYVWNTQDRIHRGDIRHGGSAVESSYIFASEEFFMMFDWWTDEGFQRCVDITPERWSTLEIYLDDSGEIDTVKTATDVIARLKQCPNRSAPFRP